MHAHHAFERGAGMKAGSYGSELDAASFHSTGLNPILAVRSVGKNFSFFVGQRLSYPTFIVWLMNKTPMLPNWRPPRRRTFFAQRGVALLRAWRSRLEEQRPEPYIQAQFPFVEDA